MEEDDSTASVADMLQKLSIATEEERKTLLSKARPFLLAPDASTKYKKYLENGDFSIIFDCLNRCLTHPKPHVKEVILEVMKKSLGENPEVEGELLRHQSLTIKGLKCLVDEEL